MNCKRCNKYMLIHYERIKNEPYCKKCYNMNKPTQEELNKEKEESEEEQYVTADPEKYCKEYGHFYEEYAIIEFDNWEGFPNHINIIQYMESEGWNLHIINNHEFDDYAELLFKKEIWI